MRRTLGEPERAVADLSRALELGRDRRSALLARGLAYTDLEQVEAALADFDAFLALASKGDPAGLDIVKRALERLRQVQDRRFGELEAERASLEAAKDADPEPRPSPPQDVDAPDD